MLFICDELVLERASLQVGMLDQKGAQLLASSLRIEEYIWLVYHIQEVGPVFDHVPPQFLRQDDGMLQISKVKVNFRHQDAEDKLFLTHHLVALSG